MRLVLLQSAFLFVENVVSPQFNEEDVDSAHGTEQQRLDCDWKAKEDCHLGQIEIGQECQYERWVGWLPRGRRAYRRAGCSGEGGTTWLVSLRIKTLFPFKREKSGGC